MGVYLYNLAIKCYKIGIQISALRSSKAKKWINGRKDQFDKLKNELPRSKNVIWIHCASLGEFEQGIPIWEGIKKDYPTYETVISFFSPSGYENAKAKYPDAFFCYLPLDTKKNAEHFIDILQPKAVFFIKYEFWYHYLTALRKRNIPTFLVSAIFRPEQVFFKWYGSFFREITKCFSHFFVQNLESQKLLNSIDCMNVTIVGDTRLDRVQELKNRNYTNYDIQNFIQTSKVFIAGSVWNEDIPIVKAIVTNLDANWKILIAPHEPSRFDYSSFQHACFLSKEINNANSILFINSVGILSNLYRFSSLAYIGGGFRKGIHNILEAAVYIQPIFIGPNYTKFAEAKELIKLGLVHPLELKDAENMGNILSKTVILSDETRKKTANYLAEKSNVWARINVLIKKEGYLT